MTSTTPQTPPRMVLLLEANPGLAQVLGLMLRQAGWLVETCTTPDEMSAALSPERLLAWGIGLVLADLDGGTPTDEPFLGRLRTAAILLPVLVITPYGQEKIRTRLGDRSGCFFLTSPLTPEEMQSGLARACRGHQVKTSLSSQKG